MNTCIGHGDMNAYIMNNWSITVSLVAGSRWRVCVYV